MISERNEGTADMTTTTIAKGSYITAECAYTGDTLELRTIRVTAEGETTRVDGHYARAGACGFARHIVKSDSIVVLDGPHAGWPTV